MSEKLMLYAELSYLDFTLETLSSGPSFCKSMAQCYAFLLAPRSDGVNAADGAKCPVLAGCWSTLGSNKTFHAGQEPVPFPRLQLYMPASPVSSRQKPSGQLSKCRARAGWSSILPELWLNFWTKLANLAVFSFSSGHWRTHLLWDRLTFLRPQSCLTFVTPAPRSGPLTIAFTTWSIFQGLLSRQQVWVFGSHCSLCCCSSPMTAFGSVCICLFCCQRETDYFPGALLWFDNAKHKVEADSAHFHICGIFLFGPALLHADLSAGANEEWHIHACSSLTHTA